MGALRHFARTWRGLALALVVLALAARLLVPVGFMSLRDAQGARLVPCAGQGPMAMPGHHGSHHGAGHDRDDHSPCGFGALAAPAIGGADAPLLAGALAIIIAHGLAATPAPAVALPARLRPPLRAPPGSLSFV